MLEPITMEVVWATLISLGVEEYGMTERQAQIYAWGCCARAASKDWEKREH